MNLNLQPFATLVTNFAVALQAAWSGLSNFTVGSLNLAIGQASASASLWLQALAFKLQLYARAATCFGSDLDSWVNQFGVTRLGANSATGLVTFNRFSAFAAATTIPVGTLVQNADGSQVFAVTADAALSYFDPVNNWYNLGLDVMSISVPVQATTSGSAGNLAPGLITQLTSSISSVDYVTNPGAMSGGADAETDVALRARFILFINSLSRGTAGAVGYAILSLQLGLNYQVVECQNYANPLLAQFAYFYVVVDDGTGAPPTSLLTSVWNAVNAVRALGIGFSVFAPVIVNATVSMTIATATGYTHATVVGIVYQAVATYVNSLPLGASLDYFKISQIAYDASPGVQSVTGLLINGGTSSIAGTPQTVIKVPTVSVS